MTLPGPGAPITVRELRRYPVKSMGGESLHEVIIDERGLQGDRRFAICDSDNRLTSGKNTRRFRRRDAVFDFSASTTTSGVEVTTGTRRWTVTDLDLDAALAAALGAEVRVVAEGEVSHQDRGAVSLVGTASLDWCHRRWGLDADPRRLRVNVVVETEEPFIEEEWVGRDLVLGHARLRVVERTPRCRMIDVAQDGARADGGWLGPLTSLRGMYLGVYADVIDPGTVGLRDAVVAD